VPGTADATLAATAATLGSVTVHGRTSLRWTPGPPGGVGAGGVALFADCGPLILKLAVLGALL
jgi:hypothetical protein